MHAHSHAGHKCAHARKNVQMHVYAVCIGMPGAILQKKICGHLQLYTCTDCHEIIWTIDHSFISISILQVGFRSN